MNRPWMKFYPADWRADPRLRMCSLAARGLWIDLISYMHEGEPYGHLTIDGVQPDIKDIASLVGRPIAEVKRAIDELQTRQVFSCTDNGIVYSRRMVRDKIKADSDRENGKGGGHPDIRRGTVPKEQRVRRFRRSDAPAKARRIFDRSNGACHWCQNPLDPENYHIDHVVAVRDGGTNDESNLVASCVHCNGERAMIWGRSDSDLMVGKSTDLKAQKPEAREDTAAGDARASPSPHIAHLAAAKLIWKIIGIDPDDPTWFGQQHRVAQWLADWDLELDILPTLRRIMAKPPPGKIRNLKYFEPAIADAYASRTAPLPVGVPQVNGGKSNGTRGNVIAAADDLIEGIRAFSDLPPSRDRSSRICSDQSPDVIRLLPGRRSK